MTQPLSPAAQAVLAAYGNEIGGIDAIMGSERRGLAAALRATADQLAQIPIVVGEPLRGSLAKSMAVVHVADLLAIAAELGAPRP